MAEGTYRMDDPYKRKENPMMERDYAEAEYAQKDARSMSVASLAFERLEKTISMLGDITDGYENRLTAVLGPTMLSDPQTTMAEDAVENRSPLVRQIDNAQERLSPLRRPVGLDAEQGAGLTTVAGSYRSVRCVECGGYATLEADENGVVASDRHPEPHDCIKTLQYLLGDLRERYGRQVIKEGLMQSRAHLAESRAHRAEKAVRAMTPWFDSLERKS